ncbi:MAG: hypothetical protein JWO83_4047, partial [Caulobacteraceae bacterium]|nr:hypothetical protein [Caulobacteraceae bacterium]
MPTIVDSLIVTLGLDASKFSEGHKKAIETFNKTKTEAVSTAKEMEAQGKKAGEFYGGIKKEFLSLAAVLIGAGGIEQFISKTVTGMSALGRQSKLMGGTVGDLAAVRNYIARLGGDSDAAAASLQNLAETMERAKILGQWSPELVMAANTIGANPTDNWEAVYQKFANWASSHKKDPQLVNLYGKQLGLSPDLIFAATKGGKAVAAGIAESYRLGVPNDEDIKRVTALQGAFATLRQTITGDANQMLFEVADPLSRLLTVADRFAEKNPAMVKG